VTIATNKKSQYLSGLKNSKKLNVKSMPNIMSKVLEARPTCFGNCSTWHLVEWCTTVSHSNTTLED
jgi:hypothetical protein